MTLKWPPRWRHGICIEVRWRQRELSESYCFDGLVSLSHQAIRLGHVVIFYTFSGAISIAVTVGGRDGQRHGPHDVTRQGT